MIERLCAELDAEAVTLSQDEIDAIPSQQGKQRRYRFKFGRLSNWKKAIVKLHPEDKIEFF